MLFSFPMRRYPIRLRTCVASMLIGCSGLILAVVSWGTATYVTQLDDTTSTYNLIALLLATAGFGSGLIFGRAPRLFAFMLAFAAVTFAIVLRFPRAVELPPMPNHPY